MTRTPEPELMETREQAVAYAAADLAEVNEPVARWFQTRFKPLQAGSRLLDIGCGTADLTIRLMRAYAGASAHGIDGSAAMLEQAHALVRTAGMAERITLEQRYFPDSGLDRNYDAVTAHHLLHHLGDPVSFWRVIAGYARPGAPVMVSDLRRPDDDEAVDELVQRYAWRALPPLKLDFHNSLRAAYTPDEVAEQLCAAGVGQLSVEPLGALHLVVWGYGA